MSVLKRKTSTGWETVGNPSGGGGTSIPTITVESSQVVSSSPLVIQLTSEQALIAENADYTQVIVDTTALGMGKTLFTKEQMSLEYGTWNFDYIESYYNIYEFGGIQAFTILYRSDNKQATLTSNEMQTKITYAEAIEQGNTGVTRSGLVYNSIKDKEDNSNKVISISSSSTDVQYPSAKCVYDLISEKIDNPTEKTSGQVLTYDGSGWVANSPSVSMYQHNVCLTFSSGQVTFSVLTTTSTAFTATTVLEYLYNKGFTSYSKLFPANIAESTQTYGYWIGVYIDYSAWYKLSVGNPFHGGYDWGTATGCTDTVMQIT